MALKRGGALVGQGTYGCVYNPAIACAGISMADTSTSVGKVFASESDADIDMSWTKLLAKIDPTQKWFIYPTKKCRLQDFGSEPESEVAKCEVLLPRNHSSVFQTIMFDGGITLNHFVHKFRPPRGWSTEQILDITRPVFLGVQALIRRSLIHQDLKCSNIVVDENGSSRIIDFGLLTSKDDWFGENTNVLFEVLYHINPPEYRLLRNDDAVQRETLASMNAHTRNFTGLVDDLFIAPKHQQSLDRLWSERVHLESTGTRPRTRSNFTWSAQRYREMAMRNAWYEKSDVFSLGLMMVLCMQYMRRRDALNPDLLDVVNGMIMPHPDERMSIDTVIGKLENLVRTQ